MNSKFICFIAITVLSVMVYSALAATISSGSGTRVQNHANCSLAYFRKLVMESCERLPRPKEKRSLFVVPESSETHMDMPFLQRYAIENKLPQIPQHELPPNIEMIAKMEHSVTGRTRRNIASAHKNKYFLICCKEPNKCTNLPCPSNYRI